MSTHRLARKQRNSIAILLTTIAGVLAAGAVLIVSLTATSATKSAAHVRPSTNSSLIEARAAAAGPTTHPGPTSHCVFERPEHRCIWVP
jgi:hypothetical protein